MLSSNACSLMSLLYSHTGGKYGNIDGWKPDRLFPNVASALRDTSTTQLIPYTHVFITTKFIPELSQTPSILAPLLTYSHAQGRKQLGLDAQPVYVVMQNGLGVERDLYNAVSEVLGGEEPRVVGTAVWIGTNMSGANVVEHNDFDRVTLGLYHPSHQPTSSPSTNALLDQLNTLLSTGGTQTTLTPSIQRVKFAKNLWNIGFAATCTLTGWTIPAMCRARPSTNDESAVEDDGYEPWVHESTQGSIEEYVWPNIRKLLEEAVSVGRACGLDEPIEGASGLPDALVDSTMANTRTLHVRPQSVHIPSMLLDKRLGRPIEVEGICGELVRMAREVGVDVPRIEMLYSLLLVVQNQILREVETKKNSKVVSAVVEVEEQPAVIIVRRGRVKSTY